MDANFTPMHSEFLGIDEDGLATYRIGAGPEGEKSFPIPAPPRPSLPNYIKELATDVMLVIAATIGTILMLSSIAAFTHHPATPTHPTHTHTTASRIVDCNYYLSHAAMVTENDANIPPKPSFCTIPAS